MMRSINDDLHYDGPVRRRDGISRSSKLEISVNLCIG